MKNHYRIFSIALLFAIPFHLEAQSFHAFAMGTGMAGIQPCVKAMACIPNNIQDTVYAGGTFDTASSLPARNIAIWHGNNWSPLGSGINNEVDAIAQFNNKIYAGGKFDSAGGILSHYIACWNGTQWDSVLSGLNGNLYALTVYQNALYVGGNFTTAGGISAKHIAKWDGANWDSVGAGFDTTVYALTVFNNTLYAGGAFLKTKGSPLNHIAVWDGTNWDSLQHGVNNTVFVLDSFYYKLYAGGAFTMAGGSSANYIAQWTGAVWMPLITGTNDTVRALGKGTVIPGVSIGKLHSNIPNNNPYLLVGGNFTTAGGTVSPNVSFWDGLSWDGIGNVNKPVFAACDNSTGQLSFPSTVYIGGAFDADGQGHGGLNYAAAIQLDGPGGVNEITHEGSISIYPNPNSGAFVVKSEEIVTKSKVEVYNMLGEKVYNAFLPNPTSQYPIDLSGQPSGVYLCRLLSSDGTLIGSEKIILR